MKKNSQLRQENETLNQLAQVVQKAMDAIIVQDIDGKIVVWNTQAEKFYGYSPSEALGMEFMMIVPSVNRVEECKKFTRVLAGETLQPYQSIHFKKDGTNFPVYLTTTALVNDRNEIYAVSTQVKQIALDIHHDQS